MWFGGKHDGFTTTGHAFEFRPGGVESSASRHLGGFTTTFDATYQREQGTTDLLDALGGDLEGTVPVT